MFPEQGCMSDNGGLMDFSDAIDHMKSMRISKSQFIELFAAEEAARTNGKTNGKKHPMGAWVEEESYETTINTMFWDGPPCMWIIAHRKCHDMQNNFLINLASFFKRKYPENWDKALEWANFNVLSPPGNAEKLLDITKRMKNQEYEYKCNDEPIHSFCDPHGCRLKKYGVGSTNGINFTELGMTIIHRIPRLFIVNVGDVRMSFDPQDVTNQNRYRDKCVAHGLPIPPRLKNDEWDKFMNKAMDEATHVEPTRIMRTNAFEIDFLTKWLEILVPSYMRVGSKENEDTIRVKVEEKRIFFKDYKLMRYCNQCNFDDKVMRTFIDANCQYHDRKTYRDWWRCTYSVSFDMFDEEIIEKWMSTDDKGSVQ
jgi:hypothetical protein